MRQARAAITAGALLVALYVLSDFGAVATMRYEVFTWVIYGAYRNGFDPTRAATLSLVLVALAVIVVVAESNARGRAGAARLGAGAPRTAAAVTLGRATPAALAFCAIVLGVAIGFPLARVVHWVTDLGTTDITSSDVWSATRSTVGFALVAALVTVVVAVPVGVLAARWRNPIARTAERATYVAHALPGIVIAISLVYVGVRLLRPIYQEPPLLVIAYVVLFLPLAVGAVRSSIEQSPERLEEVARSLGDRPWTVVRRVTLPLALPGLAAGAALVLLSVTKELPATLLLRPTGTETLATQLWRYTSVSDYANAGPFAVAIVAVTAVPTALLSAALIRRGRASALG